MIPKISVIVPVYKVEDYLSRCINSILAQEFTDFECILVDDGSPDACGNICDEYEKQDNRIKVIHKENGGVSDARNIGIKIAVGEYITFIDSDDYVTAQHLSNMYELAEKYDADMVTVENYITDKFEIKDICNNNLPSIKIFTGKQACNILLDRQRKYAGISFVVWGKLIKSYIVKKYNFPVGHNHEDEAIIAKYYYSTKKIVVSNKATYAYYNNQHGIMGSLRQSNKKNYDAIWAMNYRVEFFEELGEFVLADKAYR